MKKIFSILFFAAVLFGFAGCKHDVLGKVKTSDHVIYTVTFDSNNGSGDKTIQTCEYAGTITFNENTFTNPGYTFDGWATWADPTIKSSRFYQDKQEYTVLGDITLYAKWIKHDCVITFDYNSQETNLGSEMNEYSFVSGLDTTLPGCTFSQSEKGFRGWATSPDSKEVVYKDGQAITAGTFEKPIDQEFNNITLYAVWETPDYWVTFYPNGGTGSAIKQGFFAGEKQILLPCSFTKIDYVLKGWSTASSPSVDASINYNPGEEITVTASKSLYAVWSQHKTVIRYVANGGEGSMYNTEFFYSTGTTVRSNGYTREHYTFRNWNTKSDGSGISYSSGEKITLSTRVDEIVLYAQWDIQKYTLSYVFNKPTPETSYSGSMLNATVEYGQTVIVQNPGFSCTHYTFQGWNTKSDGSGKTIAAGTQLTLTDDVGNVNLYAQWKAKQYTITYHSNQDTYYGYTKDLSKTALKDTVTTQKYYYGDKVTLKLNSGFTDTIIRRENGKGYDVSLPYNFRGWGTSKEAKYVESAEIASCTWGDKELYGIYYYKNGPLAVYLANYPADYNYPESYPRCNDRYFGYASSGKFTMTKFNDFSDYINIGFTSTSNKEYVEYATGSRGSAYPASGTYTKIYEDSTDHYYYYKPTYFYAFWFEYDKTNTVKGSNTFQYDYTDSTKKTRIYGMDMGRIEVTNKQYYQVMGYSAYNTYWRIPNRPHIFENYEAYYFIDKLNYFAGYSMQYFLDYSTTGYIANDNIPKLLTDSRWIYNLGTTWDTKLSSTNYLYCARNLDSFRIPDETEWLYMVNGSEMGDEYKNYQTVYNYLYAGCKNIAGYYKDNSSSTLHEAGGKGRSLNQMEDVCGNLQEIVHYNGLYDYIIWNKNGNYTNSSRPFAPRVYKSTTDSDFKSKAYGGSYNSTMAQCKTIYGNNVTVSAKSNESSTLGLRLMRQTSWYNYIAN